MAAEKKRTAKNKGMEDWQNTILLRAALLTPFQKMLLVLFCLVFMVAGLYFPVFQHRLEQLAKYRKHLVFQQGLLASYQAKAEEFEEVFRKIQEKNHQFLAAAAALPHERQSARLLAGFSRAGQVAQVNLLSIREEREISLELYQKIPWTIQVSGSYARIMDFLFQIASLDRMVIIETMELTRGKKDSLIYMDCTAAAFTFPQ